MPIHTLRAPYDQFRGAVRDLFNPTGMVLFDSPRGGLISRKYVIPSNPGSSRQQTARNALTAAAAAYTQLTPAQVSAWQDAAITLNRSNQLGVNYTLSGINLYCLINSYRIMAGESQVSTPPVSLAVPAGPLLAGDAYIDTSTNELSLNVDLSSMASGDFIFVQISPAFAGPSRRARRADMSAPAAIADAFYTVTTTTAAETIAVTPTATYPVEGYMGIRLTPLSQYYVPGTALFARSVHFYEP